MGNDLISRSAVIKAIHNLVEQHRNDGEVLWTGDDWLLKEDSVVDVINKLPAAYDVDKAMSWLEERAKYLEEEYAFAEARIRIDEVNAILKTIKSGGID